MQNWKWSDFLPGDEGGGTVNGIDGWKEVIDKVQTKLRGWNASSILMRGMATLVQSTLSALPLYWLSFFPLPKGLAEKLKPLCWS